MVCVALVAALLYLPPPAPSSPDAGLYVWALFSALSLLGAAATLFPHICGRVAFRAEVPDPSRTSIFLGVSVVHGHHPPCEGFQGHEFSIDGKTYCASCAGLLIGASTAIVMATLHFVYGFTYPPMAAPLGLCLVAIGLLHVPLLRTNIPLLRFTLNAGLVAGFALTLTKADMVGGSGLGLIVIGMCIIWILTRIQLSSWDHDKICINCGYKCVKEGAQA